MILIVSPVVVAGIFARHYRTAVLILGGVLLGLAPLVAWTTDRRATRSIGPGGAGFEARFPVRVHIDDGPRRTVWNRIWILVLLSPFVLLAVAWIMTAMHLVGAVRSYVTVLAFPLLLNDIQVWQSARPLRLTPGTVSIPVGMWSRDEVALGDIAGVGLRCIRSGTRARWYPFIWNLAGECRRVGWASLGDQRFGRTPTDYQGYLAGSCPGREASAIYEACLARQGPGGLLASRHYEQLGAGPWDPWGSSAFWSPAGSLGAVGPAR